MKKLTVLLALVVLTTFAFQSAFAQTAAQTVTLEVKAVNKISVSGPVSLLIDDAVPGAAGLIAVSNNISTYSLTHNGSLTGKVTASINSALPTGIKLELTLASTLGTSLTNQDISNATTAIDVVNAIGKGKDAAQMITYNFSATPEAGTLASVAKVVTLTVTN
jgi:hypothetical protein